MTSMPKNQRYSPRASNRIITVPNAISFLRICSIPYIAWLIAHHQMVFALIMLAIGALSDCLDGYIARTCNQVSLLGQILDPIADRLLIVCSILALACIGVIPWLVLAAVIVRDAIMAILILILAQHNFGPLPVNFMGKTGTALLMMSIVAMMILNTIGLSAIPFFYETVLATSIWGIVLYWSAGVLYVQQTYALLTGKLTILRNEDESL